MPVVARNAHLAIAIARQLGAEPLAVRPITGLGDVNHVFVVDIGGQNWVIRFKRDAEDDTDYSKEAYCLQQAARHGIPVPDPVAHGEYHGVQYLVESYVAGPSGHTNRSPELWQSLGAYAQVIHSIQLDECAPESLFSRFGRDITASWRMHVDYNIAELTSNDPLLELGVYEAKYVDAIRAALVPLRELPGPFWLIHGDLRPANVILPDGQPGVLLDWGSATTGPVPHAELAGLLADHRESGDPTMAELAFVSRGCGLDLTDLFPVLEDMLLLDRMDLVRWALDARPTRVRANASLAREEILRRFS